ncbi:hypothetical protein F2Q68_00045270, partial [Brassica cretica]
ESQSENLEKRTSSVNVEVSPDTDNLNRVEPSDAQLSLSTESAGSANESSVLKRSPSDEISERVVDFVSRELDSRLDGSELIDSQRSSSATNASDSVDVVMELEKTKKEMKMLENALQGAARQAQAKADEIAKLMHENEQLKSATEDLKRKSNEAEVESLREEYHQRVATLERKVYALTKERDTLRREHNKKSDAAALLKEKDEIINQVMAEGEELSKKQAAQEGQIRKLRAQSEENKVESIKRDKTATEKLLQETIEKHQAELASQKEYYSNALAAAKEAQALAEERTNNEARIELENRLKEAGERESMLVVFREDMFRRELEDLQRRYQASERRCEELITQVPESTRPLLRQIEAMQETTARRAEAWGAVERTLNARLQEAETKAATAEERERSVNERLSQTLSRINVLEAQLSCLRAEQGQLSKSLEKERQRAAENRQEYLAAKEEADTLGGRANQLEVEIMELRRKHKQELQEVLLHNELIQKDLEREKATRLDLERTARINTSTASEQLPISRQNSTYENGGLQRKLSSASSLGSMEESYFLQASLDSSDKSSEKRSMPEATMSPYYMKSITPSAYEATLRQKEGELASYMSRLASMESIRDSLAEELVKMTAECEKLRGEADRVPGIKAELEALRQRHAAALELMGERDEELEELRADIVDLKEMYKEQVNMLVNKVSQTSHQSLVKMFDRVFMVSRGRSVEAKQVTKTRRIIVSLGRRVKRIWVNLHIYASCGVWKFDPCKGWGFAFDKEKGRRVLAVELTSSFEDLRTTAFEDFGIDQNEVELELSYLPMELINMIDCRPVIIGNDRQVKNFLTYRGEPSSFSPGDGIGSSSESSKDGEDECNSNASEEDEDVDLSVKEEDRGKSVRFSLKDVVKRGETFQNKSKLKAALEMSAMKNNFDYKVVNSDRKL